MRPNVTTIKKVLCAIDLTKASHKAFDRALSIARASKARLYVLHVVPATHSYSRHQSERLKLLTSLRERAEREGVPVRTVEQHGDPAEMIVLHADSRKADLVVIGSNRRRGWQRFRRGFRRRTRAAACGVAAADCSAGPSIEPPRSRNFGHTLDTVASGSGRARACGRCVSRHRLNVVLPTKKASFPVAATPADRQVYCRRCASCLPRRNHRQPARQAGGIAA